MVTISQYVEAKYGKEKDCLLNKEAKVFGIPTPLPKGWLYKYGNNVISEGMFHQLVNALGRRLKNGNKFAINALDFIENQIDIKKRPEIGEQKYKSKKDKERGVFKFVTNSKIKPTSPDFLSSFEWRSVRMMALKKYGAVCQCCGANPKTGAVLNVDHIKPRKTHPHLSLDINNLQILCEECNHGKGNWDSTDWRK